MVKLQIMEQYHWSWEDIENTPARILDLIIEKNNIDYKLQKNGK